MSEEVSKDNTPGTFTAALARLVGAQLGLLALGITYLAGIMSGVGQSTALIRGVVAGLILFWCGRILGWFAGRSVETLVTEQRLVPADDTDGKS